MKRLALAIARDLQELPDLPGTARHVSNGLAIVHVEPPDDVLEPSLETLQAYASTVATLHARETILPLRFGSLHESSSSLDDWLRVRGDEWRLRLDEFEDCDEMGLRVLFDPVERPPRPSLSLPLDRPGTAYLGALKARLDASDAVQEMASKLTGSLRDRLGGTFRQASVESPGPGRERLLSLAYLVPRTSLDPFRQAIASLETSLPGKLLLTGPWPPYSFAAVGSG